MHHRHHDVASNLRRLVDLLTDPEHDPQARKLRLQGFRGQDLTAACATGSATSLAPATCGVVSAAVAATGSALLAVALAITAGVGVIAENHPVEMLHNAAARRLGRPEIPPNRAAKRFACGLGATLLVAAAASSTLGAAHWALAFALVMTVVPLFVAASGICVPSLLFSLALGIDAATAPTLRAALARRTAASRPEPDRVR